MRFLADENFPAGVVRALRETGHDVEWVRETTPGAPDAQLLRRAAADGSVILTFDKDFGELAVRNDVLPGSFGVILFRIPAPRGASAVAALVSVIESRQNWLGQMAVVESGRVRIRAFRDARGPSA